VKKLLVHDLGHHCKPLLTGESLIGIASEFGLVLSSLGSVWPPVDLSPSALQAASDSVSRQARRHRGHPLRLFGGSEPISPGIAMTKSDRYILTSVTSDEYLQMA
jgi:hypothetical protein